MMGDIALAVEYGTRQYKMADGELSTFTELSLSISSEYIYINSLYE
jgi:hypothetical protein